MNRIDQPVEFFSLFRMLPEAIFHASPIGVRRKDAPNTKFARSKFERAFSARPRRGEAQDAPNNLTATAVRLVKLGKDVTGGKEPENK